MNTFDSIGFNFDMLCHTCMLTINRPLWYRFAYKTNVTQVLITNYNNNNILSSISIELVNDTVVQSMKLVSTYEYVGKRTL
jgi:hypothetical protein